MITIKFIKHNQYIVGYECFGHADYAEYGSDIVCASVSAIIQTGALGILNVLSVPAIIDRDDSLGKFNLRIPKNISEQQLVQTQIIFKTVLEGVCDLQKGYPKNIKVEEK